jgi:hypothetical protein
MGDGDGAVSASISSLNSKDRKVVIDLMGVAEAAKFLNVSRQRFAEIEKHNDFPHPAAELACGRIWLRADIELWDVKHPRVTGRPRRNRRRDDPKG